MNNSLSLTIARLLMWGGWAVMSVLFVHVACAQKSYTGYRLYVKDVEVLRRGTDYIKLRCTLVNTGSHAVDLSRRDQAHWVTINYDPSFFELRLGGYRTQFVEALFGQKLVLAPGAMSGRRTVLIKLFDTPSDAHRSETPREKSRRVLFSARGSEGYHTHDPLERDTSPCGDLAFEEVRISQSGKRWVEIAFELINRGEGPVSLKGKRTDGADGVRIAAYISGVPELTRGAILIGGQAVLATGKVENHTLLPAQTMTGKLRIDLRARTRYLNVLLLQIQTFGLRECDNTNNTTHLLLP